MGGGMHERVSLQLALHSDKCWGTPPFSARTAAMPSGTVAGPALRKANWAFHGPGKAGIDPVPEPRRGPVKAGSEL